MGEYNTFDVAYARFRQQLQTRPTRARLGITLTQEEALAVLADEEALRTLYDTWNARPDDA